MEQSTDHPMLPPAPPNRRRKISAEDWETQRLRIEQLYSAEDMSLDDVMSVMEIEYGFQATKRQYDRRISQWHLAKNVKDSEIQYIARKQKKRKVMEGKNTAFRVRSRTVEQEKIARTIKRKGISEDALLVAPSPPTPSDISYYTPQPTGPMTPYSLDNQPPVSQMSTLAPGPLAYPLTAGSTWEMFSGQSPPLSLNLPAFLGYTGLFPGQSPLPFPTLPGNPQSPSSPWKIFHEAGEFENTLTQRVEYARETCETKLTKLVELICRSEEIENIDYAQTMFEVNALVYDLVTEDKPKFDVLFEEALDESRPSCYICTGLGRIGNSQMAQKVESERLLLEAIAVSIGRFGEDNSATLHFRYNLLVLYRDWSCREDEIPAMLAQIAQLVLRLISAGKDVLSMIHLISITDFKKLGYSCRFHHQEEYSMFQSSLTPWDQGDHIEQDLWNMAVKFGTWTLEFDNTQAYMPILDLLLQQSPKNSTSLRSVHFWMAVFLLAIGRHREPIFRSRHIITISVTQTHLQNTITLIASLEQLTFSEQAEFELDSELAMGLVEVSLEEIERMGGSGVISSVSKLLSAEIIMNTLNKAAENGNSGLIILLAKYFKGSEFHGEYTWEDYTWEDILNHSGEVSDWGLASESAPLCVAARAGHEPTVRALIYAGGDIDGPSEADQTPLEFAIEAKHYSVIRLLLEEGASMGIGAMTCIIDSSDRKLHDLWRKMDYAYNLTDVFQAVLHIADTEQYDHYDMLFEKIQIKFDEFENMGNLEDGLTSLAAKVKHFSSELSHTLWLYQLKGHEPGWELILNSITGRHVEQQVRSIMRKVFVYKTSYPYELLQVDEPSGLPILHLLVSRNAPNALSVFLDLGADTKITDEQGNTALHIAASRSRISCARLLLQHGIDAEALNALGQTAIHLADQHQHRAFVGELVSYRSAQVGLEDMYYR